jgi:hypothetical protein
MAKRDSTSKSGRGRKIGSHKIGSHKGTRSAARRRAAQREDDNSSKLNPFEDF